MKTYKNISAEWGDTVGGLVIEDYERQSATFAMDEGKPAACITADDEHIYADGVIVADAEVS